MSLILNLKVTFKDDSTPYEMSDRCFDIVTEACRRRLAVNEISQNSIHEIVLKVSNSYIFCEAEKILLDDYSVPFPTHFERLTNLQYFIKFIMSFASVDTVSVIMHDDGNEDYEHIRCKIDEFASLAMKGTFQKYCFAYIFDFI